MDASLATQPLVDAFVLNFTGKTTSDMGIEYTNTHPSYVKLINIVLRFGLQRYEKTADVQNIVLIFLCAAEGIVSVLRFCTAVFR